MRGAAFTRIYAVETAPNRVDIVFSPDAATAAVNGVLLPAERAVEAAKRVAAEQGATLGAYIHRREQWEAKWGELL